MNTQPIAVKFVNWEVDPLDTLKDSRVYGLRLRLNNGDKMSREDKNWLAKNLHRNSYFNGAVPLMGYRFDFSDVIHTYLVKQYGNGANIMRLIKQVFAKRFTAESRK